jgi:hypothetical protein
MPAATTLLAHISIPPKLLASLIVLGICIVIALIKLAVRKGRTGPPAVTPQVPACTVCGTPGRWIAESNAWGCDRCRTFITTARSG